MSEPDDRLPPELLAAAKDELTAEDSLDPRWAELAAGALDDAEAAELADLDDASRALFEALAPAPSSETHERLTDLALDAMGPAPAAVVPISRAARWPRRAAFVGGVLAAAAVALLVLRPASGPSGAGLGYSVTVQGDVRETRGDDLPVAARRHLLPDGDLTLTLTPAEPGGIRDQLVAMTFLSIEGAVSDWPAPVSMAPSGQVTITGRVATLLPGRAGDLDLLIVVGRPADLPANAAQVQEHRDASSRAWDLIEVPVRVGPGPGAAGPGRGPAESWAADVEQLRRRWQAGRVDEARQAYRDRVGVAIRADDSARAVGLAVGWAGVLSSAMQYASALDVLDEVDALVGQLTRPAYLRQRASVVWAVGDGPRALALLDEAGSGPETLRARARILATIGRLDAAEALLTDQAPPPRGCERARFLTLLGAIQARRRAGDAAGPLEAALLELDVHCRELAVGLHLDLADAAARRGDEDAATRHMAALFEATPRPPSAAALRAASIDAALALARGDAVEAARVWQRRTPGRSVDARWRHAMGLAEAWAAQGRAQDAIRALRDAESALDDALLPVPLGAARLSDQGDHHRSAALLVELLTRSGDADAAADAGRLAVERTARLARRAVRLSALRAPDLRRWAAAVGRMQQDRGVATVALELLEPPLPGDR